MTTTSKSGIERPDTRAHANGEVTRRAIVLAAIRVIAQYGIDGSSLRGINVAAGSKNSSAAHYHFGSKAAVLESALRLIYAEVDSAQGPLLAALEERARQGRPSARQIRRARGAHVHHALDPARPGCPPYVPV